MNIVSSHVLPVYPNQTERHTLKIIVYGTLKRGFGNHNRYMRYANFVKDVSIPGYKLYYSYNRNGEGMGFPVAAKDKNSTLLGEMYEIPEGHENILVGLDSLEGEGHMYHRREVLDDGTQMYVGDDRFWHNFEDMIECPKHEDKFIWGL